MEDRIGLPSHGGWTILTYEGDEARGGPKGRLHRALVKFEKQGVRAFSSPLGERIFDRCCKVSEVVLQRNFDIFGDIDHGDRESRSNHGAKL